MSDIKEFIGKTFEAINAEFGEDCEPYVQFDIFGTAPVSGYSIEPELAMAASILEIQGNLADIVNTPITHASLVRFNDLNHNYWIYSLESKEGFANIIFTAQEHWGADLIQVRAC